MPRSVSRLALWETLHWTTSGLSPRARNSSRSNTRENQPRSSVSRSGSISHTPGRGVSLNLIAAGRRSGAQRCAGGRPARSREQRQLRGACGEAPTPLADEAQLLDDLVRQVPRQDPDDIGPVLTQRIRRTDRDVAAGQEMTLLVRVQVACVVDEVASHATIVEQRVALRGS